MLGNVVTFPNQRCRGAGTLLVTWPFEQADRDAIACYFDSEEGGEEMKLYESLGFVEVDEFHIDLRDCGLEGLYTHVAMVREPHRMAVAEGETVRGQVGVISARSQEKQ